MKAQPRVSVEPLVRHAFLRWDEPAADRSGVGFSLSVLADWVGVSQRTVCRWRKDGIPEREAERCALELGFQPMELWDDWYLIGAAA